MYRYNMCCFLFLFFVLPLNQTYSIQHTFIFNICFFVCFFLFFRKMTYSETATTSNKPNFAGVNNSSLVRQQTTRSKLDPVGCPWRRKRLVQTPLYLICSHERIALMLASSVKFSFGSTGVVWVRISMRHTLDINIRRYMSNTLVIAHRLSTNHFGGSLETTT